MRFSTLALALLFFVAILAVASAQIDAEPGVLEPQQEPFSEEPVDEAPVNEEPTTPTHTTPQEPAPVPAPFNIPITVPPVPVPQQGPMTIPYDEPSSANTLFAAVPAVLLVAVAALFN